MGLGAPVGVSPTGIMASQLPAEYAGANLARLSEATAPAMRPPAAFQGRDIAKGIKSVDLTTAEDKKLTPEDKKLLEDVIQRVYPALNAKKKKQFVKMKLMPKWLGDERFDEVVSRVL